MHIDKVHQELKEQEWDRQCLEFNATILRLRKEVEMNKHSWDLTSIDEMDEKLNNFEIVDKLRE